MCGIITDRVNLRQGEGGSVMKILVADDAKTSLTLIGTALQQLGHEVISASSGKEALELFKQDRPDLIILDVVMEGMDGFECAKEIRAISANDWIPIIFLSASVDDASIAKGIDAGGDDYLTKPFSQITLEAKIKAMQRIAEMRNKLFNMTEELRVLSSTDQLTGVYNRRQFERSLLERLSAAERHKHKVALMFIDIDHFKMVNDSLGHDIGDLLLRETAERLKSCLRADDLIARIGGDEFVVILSNLEEITTVEQAAKKLIQELSRTYKLKDHHIRVSGSIGVAIYPSEGTDKDNIAQHADMAMYYVKEMGRNNYQFFSKELSQKYLQQINLEQELKFALEKNQLSLDYQPICDLKTNRITGMDTLLRWTHPRLGNIASEVMVPIAEETGLIVEIGNWAFEQVCLQAKKWFDKGHDGFKISVNLSLHQILQENFLDLVRKIITETKVPPGLLELELTESTVITYSDKLKDTIAKLCELGISIGLDDFGTSHSSLTSLKHLPLSTLKIDKTFLENIPKDEKNCIIVKSLIVLGDSLNLTVVAEGIQGEEQYKFLKANACKQGQGLYLSKPVNPEAMEKLLETSVIKKHVQEKVS